MLKTQIIKINLSFYSANDSMNGVLFAQFDDIDKIEILDAQ